MVCFLCRDDGGVTRKHEMDAWVGHKVCLELGNVDVQRTIEAERSSQRGDDLAQETVQVCVGWALNIKVASANVVECLVIHHDGHVSVLQEGVHAQDCVIGLDNGSRNLWASPHCEGQLGLLPVINRQALKHEASKARPRATTNRVEDHEALQTSAIVCQLTDSIQ